VRVEHFVNRHVTLLSVRAGSVRFYTRHVDTREAAQRWADVSERGWREFLEPSLPERPAAARKTRKASPRPVPEIRLPSGR
jgi:hypothetical protein